MGNVGQGAASGGSASGERARRESQRGSLRTSGRAEACHAPVGWLINRLRVVRLFVTTTNTTYSPYAAELSIQGTVNQVTRYVAFLRAVNVGGRVVKMEELRR